MNFKTIKTEDGKKYIELKSIKLEQGLVAYYDVQEKIFLILDPDSKDYQGNAYQNKVKLENKDYGIVQKINSEAILELAELNKILRTIK